MRPIYLFVIFIVLFISCKKDKEPAVSKTELPAYTEIGANTFSFIAEGRELANAAKGELFFKGLTSEYIPSCECFDVSGDQLGPTREGVYISIRKGFDKTGTYLLNNDNSYADYEYDEYHSFVYQTDSVHTGTLLITRLDTVNKIISGKFSFTAQRYAIDTLGSQPRIVKVRGQFDVHYPLW